MQADRSERSPATTRRGWLAGALAWAASPALAAHTVRPWPAARAVPVLSLAGLDGRPWVLAGHTGQVVVLNFWATWCEPCRMEMPSLEALDVRRRADGLAVVAVNYKEPVGRIREFLDRVPFRPRIVLDADGDATTLWTPRVFPSTVLVGRDGRPTATVIGDLDWTGPMASELLEPMLAQRRTG